MLTSKQIDSLKPKDRQYKVADAEGLYLVVTPRNAKSWRYNYRVDGKYQTKVYGLYPDVSLAKARYLHAEFREWLANGGGIMPTFGEVARSWARLKEPTLTSVKQKRAMQQRLDDYILPKLGNKSIDAIRRLDFIDVVKAVDQKGVLETAYRVAIQLRMIMDYAVDLGHIESHAASNLSRVLRKPVVKHMNCIDVHEVGQLMRDIETYHEPVTRLALKLLAYTFVRTVELRLMQRPEITNNIWVIPADRMKMTKPHVVPLSRQALAVLDQIEAITWQSQYVFESPSRVGHSLSENTILFALYRLGYRGRMTGHGFRSLASTVLNQHSPFKPDVIERQLAHKEKDEVRAAYNRAEYIEDRMLLMQWWADWLDAQQ